MQGPMEALVSGIIMRGLSPALTAVLMAAPSRKTVRAQLKKIYVLDEHGEMTGEYILDADCPIDYDDFLKVLPPEGIGDRDSLFVGEYVFTAFQSGKLVFVLLSRGHLASEDVDWTALLLTAADSHLAPANRAAPPRTTEAKPDLDKAPAARRNLESKKTDSKTTSDARQAFEQERNALLAAKNELDARYREATSQIAKFERETREAVANLEKERASGAVRVAEEEKTRKEIETRVAEMSQRFAAMAKERLVASHRGPGESEEVRKTMEGEKGELARERKFLQRRAIELLDREERVRDREAKSDEREHELARRIEELATKEQDVSRQKAIIAQAKTPIPDVRTQADEAKKDIERRVKIIQEKALELLDREEKLRRRAAELEAMEARLSGRVTIE